MSALDAAFKVLSDAKEPMNTLAMIEAMATKRLPDQFGWQDAARDLYAAILRGINVKGEESRFVKKERAMFGCRSKEDG